MKNIVNTIIILFMISMYSFSQENIEKKTIKNTLNSWHQAAANAEFESYFSYMSEEAIFIGTDPTENWTTEAFKTFSKPYFDKGKAWSFTTLQRNIFFSKNGKIAWFDELLDTQMKICRGSGVLEKIEGEWKIKHYVLSIAIPNEHTSAIVKTKEIFDNKLIEKLNQAR